ncbi:hypothetical protein NLJ89_g11148 [Agrocybe chaxingu]|uniref:Uncharacterized protein n=1 Tax=Agrocybe chaxingu TaxID=84603 RepID=A0A9W8JSX7_9AGAR|nr:hypothetical protein NLJ89_g11148 [Agrocybe chaxingu]
MASSPPPNTPSHNHLETLRSSRSKSRMPTPLQPRKAPIFLPKLVPHLFNQPNQQRKRPRIGAFHAVPSPLSHSPDESSAGSGHPKAPKASDKRPGPETGRRDRSLSMKILIQELESDMEAMEKAVLVFKLQTADISSKLAQLKDRMKGQIPNADPSELARMMKDVAKGLKACRQKGDDVEVCRKKPPLKLTSLKYEKVLTQRSRTVTPPT